MRTERADLSAYLAVLLLLGSVALVVGGAVHPMLHGTASDHLRIIAQSPQWRTIHLTLLAGSSLAVVGIWSRLLVAGAEARLTVAVCVSALAIGHAVNALNTTFMTGAGAELATLFSTGTAEAATVYQAMHPFGLVAARAGNLMIALAMLGLAVAARGDPFAPGWEAPFLSGAGLLGLALVVARPESSLLILGPVALLCVWQVLIAVRVLRARPGQYDR